MMTSIDIFNYFNYEDYLIDYYKWMKASDPEFSHRTFLKRAGIAGTVYLHRIMKRERRLSLRFVPCFSEAIGHTAREARYFRTLVQFQNEKKASAKEAFLQELLAHRAAAFESGLDDSKFRIFERWYYPVIRELVCMADYGEDYKLIADAVLPRITPEEAEGAVHYLLENGFLKRTADGKYARSARVLPTGTEAGSATVRQYHKQALIQCVEALDSMEPGERDITSLTLGVSEKTFDRIKAEFKALRRRILALAQEDEGAAQVLLVSFQAIPQSIIQATRKTQADQAAKAAQTALDAMAEGAALETQDDFATLESGVEMADLAEVE